MRISDDDGRWHVPPSTKLGFDPFGLAFPDLANLLWRILVFLTAEMERPFPAFLPPPFLATPDFLPMMNLWLVLRALTSPGVSGRVEEVEGPVGSGRSRRHKTKQRGSRK